MLARHQYAIGALAASGLAVFAAASPLPAGPEREVRRGGTPVLMLDMEIASLDPLFGTSMQHDRHVLNLFYDNLLIMAADGSFEPWLATAWQVSADGLRIRFELRDGVVFHDGTRFDAAAVRKNFQRILDGKVATRSAALLASLERVDAPGPMTVEFVLSQPDASILAALASEPGMIVAPGALAAPAALHRQPAGTGPFVLVEWLGGLRLLAEASGHYWRRGVDGRALPYVDGVTVLFAPNSTVKVNSALSGDVDLADNLQIRDLARVRRSTNVTVVPSPISVSYYVSFNNGAAPFDAPEFRRAVSAAIDRDGMNAIIARNLGVISPTWVARGSLAYSDALAPQTHDKAAAKAFFERHGNRSLTLSVIQRDPDVLIAQVLQAQLAQVGVELAIEVLERQAWLSKIFSGNYQMATLRTIVPRPDPDMNFRAYYARDARANYSHIDNDDLFAAVAEARRSPEPAERRKHYLAAQRELLDMAHQAFLLTQPGFDIVSTRLHGITREYGGAWRLDAAWLSEREAH